MAEVHNHGIDPSCRERLVGECLLKPGIVVVLDPKDFTFGVDTTVEYLRSGDGSLLKRLDKTLPAIADQIEAQTKPPRIPEPGIGGVVRAVLAKSAGQPKLRVRLPQGWTNLEATGEWVNVFDWDDLVDPVFVRDGVDDDDLFD